MLQPPVQPQHLALAGLTALLLAPATAVAQAEPAAGGSGVSPEEQELRERLEERQKEIAERWRRYGDIEVDWDNWQLLKGHDDVWVAPWRRAITRPMNIGALSWPEAPTPTDKKNTIPDRAVAVDCGTLTVNRKRAGSNWGEWRVPQADSPAESMLIQACTTL